eukprot:10289885-Heterocapsa_arctica.AAC.1
MSFFEGGFGKLVRSFVVPAPESYPRDLPARAREAREGLLENPVDSWAPNPPVRSSKPNDGQIVPPESGSLDGE